MTCNILGLVLAGGRSRRMGQDKALISFDGEACLFSYVLHRFECQLDDIVISTASDHPIFSESGHDLVRDIAPFAGLGPLSGLYAALDHCQHLEPRHYDAIITIAVDTPFFPQNYVARLCRLARGRPHLALIAATHNKQHPTFALWPCHLLPDLKRHLASGERSILSFAAKVGAETVLFPSSGGDPFFNINTRQELELARQHLAMLKGKDGKRTD